MRRILLGAAVTLLGTSSATVHAQSVAIAPQVLVVDAKTRTVAITLVNSGDKPAEVTFGTLYGYPVTDSAGKMSLQTFETVSDTAPSAMSWMQVLPQRFRLDAGAQRVVRLIASPPPGLSPQEYWARLVVSAKGGRVQVQSKQAAEGINIGLDLEVRSILPIFYRHGNLATGLVIDTPSAVVQGDSVVVRAKMTRTGNAAFIGTVFVKLRDRGGRVVAQTMLPTGIYYTFEPRISLPVAGVPAGTYELQVSAETGRPDVPDALIVRGPPARNATAIVIP